MTVGTVVTVVTEVVKKITKKNFFLRRDFKRLSNKNVQICDQFFPLLFPKDSESLKILDIGLQEMGAKRRLNGTSKVNRRTNRRTDGQAKLLSMHNSSISNYFSSKSNYFLYICHSCQHYSEYKKVNNFLVVIHDGPTENNATASTTIGDNLVI